MDLGKKAFLALILSATTLNLLGQEYLIGLSEEPRQNISGLRLAKSSRSGDPYLEIPFFDDFAKPGNAPNPMLWADGPVDVSLTYGKNPFSIGVATLDLLSSDGKLHTNATVTPFIADSLTSHYINLKYPGDNSIYLSFQYQPGGNGDMPEKEDSLVLQLYSSSFKKWIRGWSACVENRTIKEYNYLTSEPKTLSSSIDTTFHNVIIQINKSEFLTDSFRIQFYNQGSLTNNDYVPGLKANADQWNIDMVYLNSGRNESDTAIKDVGFSKPIGSMLLGYESLPWKHFTPAVRDILSPNPASLWVTYYNQDPINTLNVTRDFDITNTLTQIHSRFTGGAENITPLSTLDYEILYNYNYTSPSEDSAEFNLKAYLTFETAVDPARKPFMWNDTISRNQLFKNYYAYDDGSAENGYGIFGEGSEGALVAMKFNCFVKDTLRGIYVYFNRTNSNSTESLRFYLTVWKNNNGLPGEIIYSQIDEKPIYSKELNKFVYIKLKTPIELDGPFFIGWEQVMPDMLNVGFDRNNINNDKLFYNLQGGWLKSGIEGTLMLRPVFGRDNGPTTTDIPSEPFSETTKLYPNPASNTITLEIADQDQNGYAQLYDLTGRVLMQVHYNQQVDVSGLPSGIYLVRITNQRGKTETKKLIISR
ncbi:T9SS type A sorting domain-containing protein [Williamwhitmania taraxaci]|uniref:Por secretion system C-terminal sorting domain-containing protein n=1 Tax=Williamwhitmania taraxaci TaxID=1640674 RepID=A0A1G6JI35_9BACT|nr:T9SS type A sorting domain-containing protein [Williamwhitmania taraxaci]SDC18404.1 Por secretion system C-terminal sorting domain-containing protein [Williamwhitmania taraxaci]